MVSAVDLRYILEDRCLSACPSPLKSVRWGPTVVISSIYLVPIMGNTKVLHYYIGILHSSDMCPCATCSTNTQHSTTSPV